MVTDSISDSFLWKICFPMAVMLFTGDLVDYQWMLYDNVNGVIDTAVNNKTNCTIPIKIKGIGRI